MMKIVTPFTGALVLSVSSLMLIACDRERAARDAEAEFALVMKNTQYGDPDRCRAATKARAAWLELKNQERHSHWSAVSAGYC